MSVADALRSAGALLRRRTKTVLPYYALSAATGDVARLPLLLGMTVAYVALASTGRLEPLLDDLAALNPELLSPDSPTGLPPEVGERVAAVVFSPSVAVPLVLAALTAIVVSVLARGVTRAAALSAVGAGLADGDALAAGVEGMRRWKTFAGLVVVRWGLLLVVGVPLVAAVVGAVVTLGATAAPTALDQRVVVAVLATLVAALVTLVGVVVVLALLAFAGPAAVVDDVGLVGAVRRSVGVPFAHPVGFLLYGVVVVGSYVVLGGAGVLVSIAGVDRLVTVASAFLVAPLLDGVAVALYVEWTETETRTLEAERDGRDEGERGGEREQRSVWRGVRDALGDGLSELGTFLRIDWRYVVVSALVLAVGSTAGWTATAGTGVRIETPADSGSVFGVVPVGPFVNIAVNNWFVATTAGFSGLFAGLPTLGTLLFNGVLVGAVAGVVDPVAFVAFVGPHGIVELPAIAVAGGVGFRLGHVAWRVWRGTRPLPTLVDEIGRTWRLVVGLLVVFVAAGFLEAFVTPQVAAAVLG